jgi:hypothetical protein
MEIHKNDINSLNLIKRFLRNDDDPRGHGILNLNELQGLLRELLGPELYRLINRSDRSVSMSDVKTDLRYFFELIESEKDKD